MQETFLKKRGKRPSYRGAAVRAEARGASNNDNIPLENSSQYLISSQMLFQYIFQYFLL